MRRRSSRTVLARCILSVAAAAPIACSVLNPISTLYAAGQQLASTGTLLATVLDRFNRPIIDLDADDFVIEENGQAREVLDAHIADYPVVLLVDRGASAPESEALRAAAERFVKRLGEDRAIAVATLEPAPELLVAFETDRTAAMAALARPWTGTPAARPLAATAFANRLLNGLEAPFGAIVLAWSPRSEEAFADESPQTLGELFNTRASLHVVTRQSGPDAVESAEAALLRSLAERSAGVFTVIYSVGSYAAALDGIADRLASEVMVQYLAAPARGGEPAVRAGVRIPGARVAQIRTY